MRRFVRSPTKFPIARLPGCARMVWTARRARRLLRVARQWRLAELRTPHDRFLQLARVLWIDPHSVTHFSGLHFPVELQDHLGLVMDGDWDLVGEDRRSDTYPTVASLRQVVVQGVPWKETEFYRRHLVRIESGDHSAFADVHGLDKNCIVYERVYESIAANGYRLQRQLALAEPSGNGTEPAYEVLIAIGRDGGLLFNDGQHRFAGAYVAGLPLMPVQVSVRHSEWMAFRHEIAAYAEAHGGMVPQPLLHPDLDSIPAADDCVARLDLVLDALPAGTRTVLELGARWGYYSARLSEAGLECAAVEPDPVDARFLRRLRAASGRHFDIAEPGLLEDATAIRAPCDFILALSGLGRLLAADDDREQLARALRRLQPRAIVLETGGRSAEPLDRQPDQRHDPPIEWVARVTGLGRSAQLGVVEGRSLHLLDLP